MWGGDSFVDDFMDGQGEYTYADGNKYIGEFKGDLKHGYGAMKYAGGSTYEVRRPMPAPCRSASPVATGPPGAWVLCRPRPECGWNQTW